jgi:hypothetical protein
MKKFKWFRSIRGGFWVKKLMNNSPVWVSIDSINYKALMNDNNQTILKFESYNKN